MSSFGRNTLGMMGVLAVFLAAPAGAQNIDAGKTPAQIFADTCSNCHRRAQELKKPSASFLRSHYTTGQDEAAAMASYLAGIPTDSRGSQQKKQSGSGAGSTPAETTPSRRQEQPKDQAKTQQAPSGTSKGRRPASAEAKAPAAQLNPPEPTPEPAAAPPPPPAPPLEAFEE